MKFLQTLEDHNLTQHISTATHIRGHTLDLFITRSESNLLRTKASVHEPNLFDARGNPFCDHHAIQAVLAGAKPKKISKTFTFRKWKTVDQVELSKDIVLDIPDTNPSVDELANQYDSELRDVVEKHAPLVTKSVLLRPNTQWYSDELRESKRNRRRVERKWSETGLEIHRQIFKERCSRTGKLLHQTKQDFFSKKIEDCSGDHKQLFKLSNSLMGKQHDIVLPTSTSNTELSNKFAHFFINKVTTIRNVLSQQHSFNRELSLAEDTPFIERLGIDQVLLGPVIMRPGPFNPNMKSTRRIIPKPLVFHSAKSSAKTFETCFRFLIVTFHEHYQSAVTVNFNDNNE
ncbi:Hypothetical predicted protein [Mytilus galloprovincialis]|uniref:Endonuclease/exonuclease/phosphatase domain-containing protein n=1 Tax=Mytilus galloprovincialis TaxID=29158 RepID=A0A8B6DXB0_MYTGA|nr:Hypothetical predicted protein [Mytilus galloprovincialis]